MSGMLVETLKALTNQLAGSSPHPPHSAHQSAVAGDPSCSSGPAPLYKRASEEEIAAANGIRVDRANITIDVVPESVLAKIRNDEYVELAELVHKIPKVFNLVEGEGDLKVKSKESKPRLTILDWSIAFQMYANAYCIYFPSARKDLQLYLFFISKLMKKGAKWQLYDEKFRKERKAFRLGWGEYRQLLHTEALTGARENSPVPNSPRQSVNSPNASRKKHQRPSHCYAFNSEEGCSRDACFYRHACANCGLLGHAKTSCGPSLSRKNREKK